MSKVSSAPNGFSCLPEDTCDEQQSQCLPPPPPQPGPRLRYVAGEDSTTAGADAFHFHDDVVEVDVGSVTVEAGNQARVEARMSRVEVRSKDKHLKAEVTVMEAKVHAGRNNSDGSTGVNLGIGANAVAVEGTWTDGANSVTGGVSAGVGAEGSIGLRDGDRNGEVEVCVKVGLLWLTGGICKELW